MKRIGNASSNRTYNPKNTKPPIPLDIDEVDSAMERFIRQKYDQQVYSGGVLARPQARLNTGSTGSSEDQPPPLPPKPGRRFNFGLRSASSTLPLSRNGGESPPLSPELSPDGSTRRIRAPSPIRVNKQSRVFGITVGETGESLESKMASLRNMGFRDDRRNAKILKGLGNNLERTIEALVRLGEGNSPLPRSSSQGPSAESTGTPKSTASTTTARTEAPLQSNFPAPLDSKLQQLSLSPGQSQTYSQTQIYQAPVHPAFVQPQSYNPFDTASQFSAPLQPPQNSFSNAPEAQPLFPNATGGYPSQQQQLEHARLQQSMTPPVPQLPSQYDYGSPHPQLANNNPFMQNTRTMTPIAANLYSSLPQSAPAHHGFTQPTSDLFMFQSSPNQFSGQQQPQQQHQPSWGTSHQTSEAQMQSPFQQFYPQQQNLNSPYQNVDPPQIQQQFQTLQPQRTGRIDKTSILDLYNYPQLAPPREAHENGGAPLSDNETIPRAPISRMAGSGFSSGQRSATMPVASSSLAAGSRNPFLSSTGQGVSQNIGGNDMGGQANQEGGDIGGPQNGRHSPDAFANLSARFVR